MSHIEADRLEKLLDAALDALRDEDDDVALMALDEALKEANRLPKKDVPPVICLPDESRQTRRN